MNRLNDSQFSALLLGSTPLIDVRAPIEFEHGSIPGATNLPLLDNDQREQIGRMYKRQGQNAAIELGHRLVSGEIRQARVGAWLNEIERKPDAVIFCFRGGLRSQITQAWLREAGCDRPIVAGGYKALRAFLMASLEARVQALDFEVVSGATGSGKTDFLKASGRPYLDLENLVCHRGSAFGAMSEPQPRQIDFENQLALALLRLPASRILIEDESQLIGRLRVPASLYAKIQSSLRLVLDIPIATRVENIFQDYVVNSRLGKSGDVGRFDDFQRAMQSLSKRLGGVRTAELLNDLEFARGEFVARSDLSPNRTWIRKLLEWYYDPSYRHGVELREAREAKSAL